MRSISDDYEFIGTADEVAAYEKRQQVKVALDAEIGAYLDTCTVKDKDGKERGLNAREFSRRENVLLGWLEYDREQNPWRYDQRKPEQQTEIKAVK